MRARVLTKWILYYAFGIAWLALMVFLMIGRVRTSALGSNTELTIGLVVVGGTFVAALVGFPLWVMPNVRCLAVLRRRFPDAVMMTARRDDFRAFIDVDALEMSYRQLPYFLAAVADRHGISAWMAGDPGEPPRQLVELSWCALGSFEQSTSDGPLPQYVLLTIAQWRGEALPLQLTLGSNWSGGLFAQTYGSSLRSLAALNGLRTE